MPTVSGATSLTINSFGTTTTSITLTALPPPGPGYIVVYDYVHITGSVDYGVPGSGSIAFSLTGDSIPVGADPIGTLDSRSVFSTGMPGTDTIDLLYPSGYPDRVYLDRKCAPFDLVLNFSLEETDGGSGTPVEVDVSLTIELGYSYLFVADSGFALDNTPCTTNLTNSLSDSINCQSQVVAATIQSAFCDSITLFSAPDWVSVDPLSFVTRPDVHIYPCELITYTTVTAHVSANNTGADRTGVITLHSDLYGDMTITISQCSSQDESFPFVTVPSDTDCIKYTRSNISFTVPANAVVQAIIVGVQYWASTCGDGEFTLNLTDDTSPFFTPTLFDGTLTVNFPVTTNTITLDEVTIAGPFRSYTSSAGHKLHLTLSVDIAACDALSSPYIGIVYCTPSEGATGVQLLRSYTHRQMIFWADGSGHMVNSIYNDADASPDVITVDSNSNCGFPAFGVNGIYIDGTYLRGSTAYQARSKSHGRMWDATAIPGTYTAATSTLHKGRLIFAGYHSSQWYIRVGHPNDDGTYTWSSEVSLGLSSPTAEAHLLTREDGSVEFSYIDGSGNTRVLHGFGIASDGTGTWIERDALSGGYTASVRTWHKGRIVLVGFHSSQWYVRVGKPEDDGTTTWSSEVSLGLSSPTASGYVRSRIDGVVEFVYLDGSGTIQIVRGYGIGLDGTGTWV